MTLREIAKEIGYTHAVIYQHFPDKWHILAELSRETIGLMVLPEISRKGPRSRRDRTLSLAGSMVNWSVRTHWEPEGIFGAAFCALIVPLCLCCCLWPRATRA
ncbi:MAG: TetR/AcrR family transcriptional regulator [Candidatus Sulfotelmatobacter sp.]